jgi:uncharacterized protein (DUF4415 family)
VVSAVEADTKLSNEFIENAIFIMQVSKHGQQHNPQTNIKQYTQIKIGEKVMDHSFKINENYLTQ